MYICVGKDCFDYFILCKMKYILINNCYTNIYFLSTTTKITYNPDFGMYEQFELESLDYNIEKILLFPYTSLLTPHSIVETNLNSIPVYVYKYAPLDL